MTAEAASTKLVSHGKSNYAIVISKSASPSEKHATAELQKFLKSISGAEIPVSTDPVSLPSHMIIIGRGPSLARLPVAIDWDRLGDEGFVIKTVGPHLVIAGGKKRGTMYGVYTFLERELGCRWFATGAERIPKKSSIILGKLDILETPAFEYREPVFEDTNDDADWAARNKYNGHCIKIDEDRGGNVHYGRFCHTFDEIAPVDKYYSEHPEYYSLVNGKRVGGQYTGQLCLSNPNVLKLAIDKLHQWMEEDPSAKIFSVSQNDNPFYCQCDKCAAVDKEESSPSGLMLRFVNAVADEVSKKRPDVIIDTFAYQYTEKPPKLTKPGPNVRVRLCPILCCEYHPYESCQFPANIAFMENLKGWSALTDNLYIWHYANCFLHILLPLPDLNQLPDSLRMYKRLGVKGVMVQGTEPTPGMKGFMHDLKAYLCAQLLWNPDADSKKIVSDFLEGYFGKAAKPVQEWLDLLHQEAELRGLHGSCWPEYDYAIKLGINQPPWPYPYIPLMSTSVIRQAEKLFDQAEQLSDSPDTLRRVKHARLSLKYVKVMREIGSASASGSPSERQQALEDFDNFARECEELGIKRLDVTKTMKAARGIIEKGLL